jgi:tetratricopeptide (TPR) repeat protein
MRWRRRSTLWFQICRSGAPANALPYFDRSLTIREALHGPASLLPQLDQWINQKASVQFRHLEPFLLGRLEIMTKTWSPSDPRIADECEQMAARYLHRNDLSQAITFLERSRDIKTELHGADSDEARQTIQKLTDACLHAGERDLAHNYRERCISGAERAHGLESKEPAATLVAVGLATVAASKTLEQESIGGNMRRTAEPSFERALSIEEALFGTDGLEVQKTLAAAARAYLDCRDFPSAQPLLERLLDICERAYGKNAPALAWIMATLAQIYAYDRSPRAEPMLERCLAILRPFMDVRQPSLVTRVEDLSTNPHALYASNSSGLLETLIRTSQTIHNSTKKRSQ